MKRLALTAFLRLWLVFSSALVIGVLTWAVFEHENPLISDDPHIIGFLFAFVATGLAFFSSD